MQPERFKRRRRCNSRFSWCTSGCVILPRIRSSFAARIIFCHTSDWEAMSDDDFRLALDHIGISLRRVDPLSVCDRTPAIKNAIEEVSAQPCDIIDVSKPIRMANLDLHGKHVTGLRDGDFSGMSNLQTLNLDNRLDHLPQNIFAGVIRLKKLDLSHNALAELPARIFAEAPSSKT